MGEESRAGQLRDGRAETDYSREPYEQAPPPPILLESQRLLGASAPMMRDVSDTAVTTTTESSSTIVTFRQKRPDLSALFARSPEDETGHKHPQYLTHFSDKHRLATSRSMPHFYEPTTPQDVHSVGISKILDFIFLGNASDATSKEILTTNNIRRVINVNVPNMRASEIQNDAEHFLHIPIQDTVHALLFQYFEHTFEFIESARRAGERVLVHCMAGVSRSPTIVIAYLMRRYRTGYRKALELTRRKRSIVDPNMNFISQLRMYENALSYFRIIPMSCEDINGSSTSMTINTTSATTAPVKTTKPEDIQTIPRPQRPRNLYINKSQSSDYIAMALHSNTSNSSTTTNFSTETTYGSSSLSSSSYSLSIHSTRSSSSLNDTTSSSRLSTVSSPSITSNDFRTRLRSHNKNNHRYFCGRHCSTNVRTSTSSLSSRQSTPDWLSSPRSLTTPALGDIPSPSAEFCKLDITAANPCFAFKRDMIAESQKGGRRCSTSTDVSESASSGIFTESSYDDRGDDHNSVGALEDEEIAEMLAHEAQPNAPMTENPIFNLENKGGIINPMFEHCENCNSNAKESLPLESRKSKLKYVAGKFMPNKDRENFSQDNRCSWKCYCISSCCPGVKNDSGKRCHSARTHMRSPLPPLNDEDATSTSSHENDANVSHQCDDFASDDGYSEKKRDGLLSDEEASLKGEAVMRYIIKHFRVENVFADGNNNMPFNPFKSAGNSAGETSPSKKKARMKQAEPPTESKPEDLAQTSNMSAVKPPESTLRTEKTHRIQIKRSNGGLYPVLKEDEREYETNNVPTTTNHQSLSNDSSQSLYPSLVQNPNSSNFSSTKEQTTKTTVEIFSTESEGASTNNTTTTTITGTTPLSKLLRKSPTKSMKTDVGFDNARLDPERASISSTSSLEIFAI